MLMKVGTIIYHKNIFNICEKRWIEKCIKSIINQTFQNFEILELNYGNTDDKIMKLFTHDKTVHYFKKELDNHAHAMNFLLDKAFLEMNFDIIFNVHLDDYYHRRRFEYQLEKFKENDIDIVSSNFAYIREVIQTNNRDEFSDIQEQILDVHSVADTPEKIKLEFEKGHNVIANPCVAFNKSFWRKHEDICYYSELPIEDFKLWLRCNQYDDIHFKILPDILLFYRQHLKQTCRNIV